MRERLFKQGVIYFQGRTEKLVAGNKQYYKLGTEAELTPVSLAGEFLDSGADISRVVLKVAPALGVIRAF